MYFIYDELYFIIHNITGLQIPVVQMCCSASCEHNKSGQVKWCMNHKAVGSGCEK